MFLKKGMKVKVCVGKDKGKSGEIIEINRARELAKVKEVNMLIKHKKQTKLPISYKKWREKEEDENFKSWLSNRERLKDKRKGNINN